MQIESQKQRNIFLVQASNALSTIYKLKQCNCRKYEVLWFRELIGWGVQAVKVEFHLNGVSTTCSGLSYGFPWWLPLKKTFLFISRIYLMLTCRICHNLVQWTFFLQCFFISLNTNFLLLCRCTLLLCQRHTFFSLFFFIILLFDMFATSSQNSLNKKFQGTLLMFSTLLEIVRYRNCVLTKSIFYSNSKSQLH